MINYGFTKELHVGFEQALDKVKDKLKQAGFGIVSEINLSDKFKEKLGIDYKKYMILGACQPASARKAIEAEENIGLFLPCNVILYEKGDHVAVSAIKPTIAMKMINNTKLTEIAEDVESKLKQVIDSL
jgi:uncharacterized protein (DUF302 family)